MDGEVSPPPEVRTSSTSNGATPVSCSRSLVGGTRCAVSTVLLRFSLSRTDATTLRGLLTYLIHGKLLGKKNITKMWVRGLADFWSKNEVSYRCSQLLSTVGTLYLLYVSCFPFIMDTGHVLVTFFSTVKVVVTDFRFSSRCSN